LSSGGVSADQAISTSATRLHSALLVDLSGLRLLRLGRNEPYERCRRRDIPRQRPDHFDAGSVMISLMKVKPISMSPLASKAIAPRPPWADLILGFIASVTRTDYR
jgi:hypothetical protein